MNKYCISQTQHRNINSTVDKLSQGDDLSGPLQ